MSSKVKLTGPSPRTNSALSIDPKLAVAYANRALAYEGKKDAARALADFEKALEIDPNLERAIEGRARLVH